MLFTKEEEARIQAAIGAAEQVTSGEIRLFLEDFCDRDHPVDRAAEVFQLFGMFNTKQRNAVLIYIAEKSHLFAIWGDTGIHERVGFKFWDAEKELLQEFGGDSNNTKATHSATTATRTELKLMLMRARE